MMKKMLVAFLVITILAAASACSPRSSGTQSAAETPTAESVSTDVQPTTAASTDMEAFILEKLQGHHDIDRVLNAQHTREEWNATLDRMIGYGARISEEEKQNIIDYLMNQQK